MRPTITRRRRISLPRRGNFTLHSSHRDEFHSKKGDYHARGHAGRRKDDGRDCPFPRNPGRGIRADVRGHPPGSVSGGDKEKTPGTGRLCGLPRGVRGKPVALRGDSAGGPFPSRGAAGRVPFPAPPAGSVSADLSLQNYRPTAADSGRMLVICGGEGDPGRAFFWLLRIDPPQRG